MDDRLREPAADRPPLGERLRGWFQASPAELAGLCVLLLGALVVTGLVLWDVRERPSALAPAAGIGHAVHLDEHGHAASVPTEAAPADLHAGGNGDVAPTVHVSGAVQAPGVVTLPAGSRVHDAIAAAGGLASVAEASALNLARIVVDGEQIHVPAVGEHDPEASGPGPPEAASGGIAPDGRVDVNRASAEQLESLPGIGPAKAAAIITHRETEGPFAVPGDLRAVPGIGERTFQQLADLVTVG